MTAVEHADDDTMARNLRRNTSSPSNLALVSAAHASATVRHASTLRFDTTTRAVSGIDGPPALTRVSVIRRTIMIAINAVKRLKRRIIMEHNENQTSARDDASGHKTPWV